MSQQETVFTPVEDAETKALIPLSVTDGNKYPIAKHFRDILRWYIPPPAKVLDLTCGYKIMYQKLLNHTLDGKDYQFVFNDLRKGLGDIQVNIMKEKIPYPDGSFNAVVIDPPFPKLTDDYSRLDEYGGNVTEEYCDSVVKAGIDEAHRLLTPAGMFILKIQDTFDNDTKEFRARHIDYCNLASPLFKLYDITIYRYWSRDIALYRHRFRKRQSSLRVHSYHLIFQKPLGQTKGAEDQ